MYKYSIIIPHYNDEIRLKRLLLSIPSYRCDIEIIVIDDCSSTPKKLEEIKKGYSTVTWLSTSNNSGAGKARNIGLSVARGQFLLFADSDDIFTPNAFSIIDSQLRNDDNLCYFLAEAIQEVDSSNSNRMDRYNKLCINYLEHPTEENLFLLKAKHAIPVAKVYSRKSIQQIGSQFDEVMHGNDIAFNIISAFKTNSIRVIPSVIYRVYRRKGSLTSIKNKENFLIRFESSTRLNKKLAEYNINYRLPLNGTLLQSTKYGPITFIYVLITGLKSGLKISLLELFNLYKWKRYICSRIKMKSELKKIS